MDVRTGRAQRCGASASGARARVAAPRPRIAAALALPLVSALALLPACASRIAARDTGAGAPGAPATFVYECPDGFSFVARVEGDTARVFLADRALALPGVRAASGAKYADGSATFWSKGDEALLEIGGEVRRGCANNRAKALWEDARLRGVEFRAVGQEPGWWLEITPGGKTVFVTNYGTERHEVSTPEPFLGRDGGVTVYRTSEAGHEIMVMIEKRPRKDSMSGELFESTVTVTLDGRTHRGGGRALR